ncbi:MAG: UDP-2,4-diacetamido-2,4,6-trideoxy-beta-L-altropyranose hydrolase, partial [Gallionella sp.]|nr:UDP-2,4-diacetamido-2,4,6-trideoxy-beta-L-altropyranose hydrolase [Gallionella sp.]
MRIVFRTDATGQIGTGHFMRCLTLADALKQRGAQIRFVSRDLPLHLRDMLAAKDVEFVSLESDLTPPVTGDLAHAHWLGASQKQDAQATIQALSDQSWDSLVVDHYALDARWESALRGTARQIMVIDDIADRQHDCDVLLDQNFYADMQTRYAGKVPSHCQLLLGPRYALLRDEFRRFRDQVKPRTGAVKRILVFFGGVDADNYTGRAIEALSEIDVSGFHIDVVIGAQHPRLAEIEGMCAANGFVCHVQTNRMAELMAAADLAIGAGGSATWERCCLGLPALAFCTADNQ